MKKFYVYCHKNPITKEIFYVGKGSGNRAFYMLSRGKHWVNYVNKYGIPIVEFIYENLDEAESFRLEMLLIEELGRKDLGTGLLVNSTNGGEGDSGRIVTKETRDKISNSNKGKPNSSKGKTWKQSIKRTPGKKRGCYKTRVDKGKTFSVEIKEKMKEGKRNNGRKVLQYDLNNNLIKIWRSAADVMDELKLKGLYNCLNGVSKKSGNFIWKYED